MNSLVFWKNYFHRPCWTWFCKVRHFQRITMRFVWIANQSFSLITQGSIFRFRTTAQVLQQKTLSFGFLKQTRKENDVFVVKCRCRTTTFSKCIVQNRHVFIFIRPHVWVWKTRKQA